MSNKNYKGSIELISGLTQKNGLDFPLMDAEAIAIYDKDGNEMRLPQKLETLGVSEDEKGLIVSAAVEEAMKHATITGLQADVEKNSNAIGTATVVEGETAKALYPRVEDIEKTLQDFKGDNAELRLTYNEDASTLYLHTGDDVILEPEDKSNVIASTIVKGGSGGAAASHSLILRVLDEKTSFSILQGRPAVINFNAELKDINEGTVITEENITFYLYVNDTLKTSFTRKAGVGSFDVSPYLTTGSNTIKLTASFSEVIEDTGATIVVKSTKRWSFEVIEMFIKSEFSDANIKTGSKITYTFTPYGNLEKTIYFHLNGKEMTKITTSLTDRSMSVDIPNPGHGAYPFEVWCTGVIEGETIESEHLYYDIMFAEEGNNAPIIRMAGPAEGQQYSTAVIKYTIYKADSLENEVELYVNDVLQSTKTVDRSEQTWNYKPLDFGTKELKIKCGDVSKTITVEIAEFPYEISPITANLELDFNPVGRTNQDNDYNIFKNNAYDDEGNEKPITWTLSDNFDWVNGGWQTDENGDGYFCVKAGTTATINYNLFADPYTVLGADGADGNGKEFKAIFKTTNVADVNTTFLSCMAPGAVGDTNLGLEMKVHTGYVRSSAAELDIPYCEEDIIEFDFNINPASLVNGVINTSAEKIPMVLSYEDGTPFRPMTYTSVATSFTQANPVPITIGSKDCDVHIYRMKAYGKALSDQDVLNNFIADGKNAEEIVDRFLRNEIYVNGKLTPEGLANARPDLKVIKIECPYFTNDKDNFVGNTSVEMIHRNGDPALDNWIFSNGFHSGQGTSSNKYGDAGRNIDLLMCFDGNYYHKKILKMYEGKEDEYWAIRSKFESKDGTIKIEDGTGKVGLTRTSVPTSYFNIKVNIASSENANNALIAKRFDRYLPYDSVGKKRNPFVKNTMEFVNCVVFLKESNEDLSTHREFQDTDWHFYAIGNIGDSKKTDQTRAYDPDDTKEFVVEILDNNMPNAAFQTGYYLDEEKSLIKYPIDESLWKEGNEAYDNLYADKWGGDESFEMRYEHPDVSDEQSAANIEIWNAFYKWVITSSDEEYYNNLKDWVNVPAALYYYLFTERYTMMDNRAKNSFWHWSKLYITQAEVDAAKAELKSAQDALTALKEQEGAGEDAVAQAEALVAEAQVAVDKATWFTVDDDAAAINEGYRFDWWDYDNDTSLGIDNSGKLRMPYGKEDIDKDEEGTFYFNAAESVPYRRIRKLFHEELRALYNQLEEKQCWSAEHLIQEFDTWQEEFPEAIWLADAERKYFRTYRNGVPDHLNLRMQGRKKYHRRQWDRDQEAYMASKHRTGNTQDLQILMRCKTPTGMVVKPKYTLNLIPYSDMYLNVQFGPSYIETVRAKAGEEYEITSPFADMTDNQVAIFNGQKIQSVGDISTFYPSEGTFGTAEKLKTLIVGNGTEGYTNTYLSQLTTSANNKLLEYLDIQNLSSLKTVYLGIQNLKHFFAQGSGITDAVFANNGLLEEAYLPAAINTVIGNNLYYLHTLHFDSYDNLNKLVLTNCPQIDTLNIAQQANNLTIVRLINIDWTLENATLLNRLAECSGVQADGITPTSNSVLTGTVKLGSIRESEITKFAEIWPELTLVYDEKDIIPQHTVRFWREQGDETPIYEILYDEMHLLTAEDDPSAQLVEQGLLIKESTAQYNYTFKAWNPTFEGVYVTTELDFYGTFNPEIRTYTVSWYSDENGSIISNADGEKAIVEVKYGQSAVFDETKFDTPTKNTAVADNKYHLFNGWDKSTGFITGETKVFPIWETSTANIPTTTPSTELSAVQLHALSKLTLENGLGKYVADGAQITMNLGYMPDYGGIPLIEEPVTFDGTGANAIITDYQLFNEDKNFVLAVDFTMGHSTTNKDNTLVSCGGVALNRGMRLYAPYTTSGYTAPVIQWNVDQTKAVSVNKPTARAQYRDICVIRHIKGDPNLYIYTNNRYSMDEIKLEIATSTATSAIEHKLCFGAQTNATGTKSNYGTGTIHYAKLWFDDLGDEECRKICSWIKQDITFSRCATEMYFKPDSEARAAMSFVADELLDDSYVFDASESGDSNTLYDGGWDVSDIREWLNKKVFAGISLPWQQIIEPVAIRSLYGSTKSEGDNAAQNGTIVETTDKLYLPAYAEVSSRAASDSIYNKELSTGQIYSNFPDTNALIKNYPNGQAGYWWTRTPLKANSARQVVTQPSGTIGESSSSTKVMTDAGQEITVWRNFYKSDKKVTGAITNNNVYSHMPTGVLLAFSIGEVL